MPELFDQYLKLFHSWLVMAILIAIPFVIGYCFGLKKKPLEKDNDDKR